MKTETKASDKNPFRIPPIIAAVCLAIFLAQGCGSTPGEKGAREAATSDIPGEIRQDIADRLFGGDGNCKPFRAGVKRVSLDRRTLDDVMRDPLQAKLYRHLTESIYVLAVGPGEKHHVLVYKEGELLFERTIPREHYQVLERLFRPFEGIPLPEAEEPPEITVEEFLEKLTDSVSPECKKGIEQTLLRAGRNAHELIRSVRLLETVEEKQAAYWLLARMKDYAYACLYRDEGEKTYYKHYDAQHLSADDLYEIVHYAYKARRTFPWARDLPEDRFRRFVLEYRHTDAPLTPGLRAHMFRALEPYVRNLQGVEEVVHQVNLICSYVVKYRKDMFWEDEDLRLMFATSQARCEGKSNFASEMLRSVGIPNGYVSTPAWPTIDGNHAWNAAFDGEKVLSFMGCEYRKEKPDFDRYQDSEVAKVYLREPDGTIQDLTASYTPTTDYSLEAGAEFAGQALYLNVWNSNGWRPVAKTTADEKGAATFKDVGCRSDFLFCVTASMPDKDTEALRTLVITSKGAAVDIITGADGGQPALKCTIKELAPKTAYLLKIWRGREWREVAKVEADDEGRVELAGLEGRLYKLDTPDGEPAGRPFQIKAAGEETELTKY